MNNRSLKHQQGMTLLEVAIAVMIAGVILAGAINLYDSAERQLKIKVTHDRIDMITQALSTYAETAGRVPVPSGSVAQ